MKSGKRDEVTDVESGTKIIGITDEHVDHSAGKEIIESTGAIKRRVQVTVSRRAPF